MAPHRDRKTFCDSFRQRFSKGCDGRTAPTARQSHGKQCVFYLNISAVAIKALHLTILSTVGGTSLRTGICLGLSAPFVLLGLIQGLNYSSLVNPTLTSLLALDPSTKIIFPQYAALLQVYGACFLPVIFALLL